MISPTVATATLIGFILIGFTNVFGGHLNAMKGQRHLVARKLLSRINFILN